MNKDEEGRACGGHTEPGGVGALARRGEVGADIVIEATGIRDVPSGPLLRIGDDRFIPGLRKLVQAVRELHAGRRFVSQDMAYQLAQTQAQMHPSSLLSPREFEVFRLIAQGQSVHEVAERLNLSQKTVANHVTQLKDKLNATNSAALVHLALRHNVIPAAY